MRLLPTATIAAALLAASLGPSLAADPMGNWRTEDGKLPWLISVQERVR